MCFGPAFPCIGIGIYTMLTCGEGACSRDGLAADTDITDAPAIQGGSWLACEDGLTVNTVGPCTYSLLR